MAKQQCKCGCRNEAQYVVRGYEFDPTKLDRKGAQFTEFCCAGSKDYLTESSADLGFPCDVERLP